MSTDGSLTLTSSGTAGVVAMIAPAQMIHGAVADVGVSTEKSAVSSRLSVIAFDERMLGNVVAAAFVVSLMVVALWVVNTLAGVV
jgi:hypothetical protein